MNCISYSLWGSEPRYTLGMIKNAEQASKFYPGWKVVVYADNTVPSEIISGLTQRGAEIRSMPCKNRMFARFFIALDPGVDRFVIRDADSRFTQREQKAVEDWIASGLPFHVMRDHPNHLKPVLGGMWGCAKDSRIDWQRLLKSSFQVNFDGGRNAIYDTDQQWLAGNVWPSIRDQCFEQDLCCRDRFRTARHWPARYGEFRFVGEIYDENDSPRANDWEKRINFMEAA